MGNAEYMGTWESAFQATAWEASAYYYPSQHSSLLVMVPPFPRSVESMLYWTCSAQTLPTWRTSSRAMVSLGTRGGQAATLGTRPLDLFTGCRLGSSTRTRPTNLLVERPSFTLMICRSLHPRLTAQRSRST